MIDGNYDISVDTLIGKKKGNAFFTRTGIDDVACTISFDGNEFLRVDGKMDGNVGKFNGEIESIVGKIAYDMECEILENKLEAAIKTNKGEFKAIGEKKES